MTDEPEDTTENQITDAWNYAIKEEDLLTESLEANTNPKILNLILDVEKLSKMGVEFFKEGEKDLLDYLLDNTDESLDYLKRVSEGKDFEDCFFTITHFSNAVNTDLISLQQHSVHSSTGESIKYSSRYLRNNGSRIKLPKSNLTSCNIICRMDGQSDEWGT